MTSHSHSQNNRNFQVLSLQKWIYLLETVPRLMNMLFHTKSSLFLLDFEHKFVEICVEVYPQGHVLMQGQATLPSPPSTFDQNRLHLPATMQTLIGCTRLDDRHSWAAVIGFQSEPTPRLVRNLSAQLSERCFWRHFRREWSHAVAGSFYILSW